MKILYVIHQFLPYTFAGVEVYTYDLAKEMSKRGNSVSIVSMPHKFEYKFPKCTCTYNEEFRFLKIKNKKNNLKEYKDILRAYKPDIVHFQHLQYFSPEVIEATRAMNIPSILHLHDYFYICKRIRLLDKRGRICRSSSNCPGCQDRRLTWKKHVDNVDLMLANSHFTRDIYIKNGFDSQKIMVNYPGVNTGRLGNMKHKKKGNLRFAFLGMVIKEKGIDVLIDAFNRLNTGATLEIWGGIDYEKFNLSKKIKNPRIEIKGEYEPADIKKILSGVDIVIIPSIWQEPWSIVKTEALAAGLGVLASLIGGLPEGISDSRVLLFKPNNVGSLLNAIESATMNEEFWKDKKSNRYRVKTMKKDARGLEKCIYAGLISKHTRISSISAGKRYIVNSKAVFWNYTGEDRCIKIYKKEKRDLVYSLKGVSGRFWELFTEFKPFDEIVSAISNEYDADKNEIERDIKLLMDALLKEKVIDEAVKV